MFREVLEKFFISVPRAEDPVHMFLHSEAFVIEVSTVKNHWRSLLFVRVGLGITRSSTFFFLVRRGTKTVLVCNVSMHHEVNLQEALG